MSTQSEVLAKTKTASDAAVGSSMGKSTPKVGEAPSKSNEQQPVNRNQGFSLKGLGWRTSSPAGF